MFLHSKIMIIVSLELKNFRNYEDLSLVLSPGINLFYGDNAQGKTNILEAIYICATARSHRSGKDREMIRFGEEEAHIKLLIQKSESKYRLDMHLKKNKAKGIAVNGIPIKRASELFGIVNVICFSPEDLNLIKSGPAERRRFIDFELCQLNKLYVHALISYNKTLEQRNKLLKEIAFQKELMDTLDVWDRQLIHYGGEVIKYREQFIAQLNEIVDKVHYRISGEREKLVIGYEKNVQEKNFAQAILQSRENDLKYKMTNVGPHRDDLSFQVTDQSEKRIDLKKYGSQGQQRSAALSLKLSEIELVKRVAGDYPILLLDDVLSELDIHRQRYLLNSIKHIQTVITCTGLDDFWHLNLNVDQVFQVIQGKVMPDQKRRKI